MTEILLLENCNILFLIRGNKTFMGKLERQIMLSRILWTAIKKKKKGMTAGCR